MIELLNVRVFIYLKCFNIFSVLHILEIAYNKPITEGQTHTHIQNVTQVALNQIGGINDRQLALIDVNKDLFLVAIRTTGFGRACKIGMTVKI